MENERHFLGEQPLDVYMYAMKRKNVADQQLGFSLNDIRETIPATRSWSVISHAETRLPTSYNVQED